MYVARATLRPSSHGDALFTTVWEHLHHRVSAIRRYDGRSPDCHHRAVALTRRAVHRAAGERGGGSGGSTRRGCSRRGSTRAQGGWEVGAPARRHTRGIASTTNRIGLDAPPRASRLRWSPSTPAGAGTSRGPVPLRFTVVVCHSGRPFPRTHRHM